MSKVYKCDCCERIIEDPFETKMKEFYIGCEFDMSGAWPVNCTKKTRVHLCDDCYKGLGELVKKLNGGYVHITKIKKAFAETPPFEAKHDVVEVVRCKDCCYYHYEYGTCNRPSEDPIILTPYNFCSRGRRRVE